MPAARIVEPVYVFEHGDFRLPPCCPPVAADQLGLQRLEKGLNGGIAVAGALAAHRHLEALAARDLLVVVRAILRAAIGAVNAAGRRQAQGDGDLQRADRKSRFMRSLTARPLTRLECRSRMTAR